MDLDAIKGRFAEALIEGMFRRAGYQVSRIGRESQVERLVKIGPDEFLADFLVWKPIEESGAERPLVVSQFVWKKEMAHSSGKMSTTNRPPTRAATGGMRHGEGYQEAGAGA